MSACKPAEWERLHASRARSYGYCRQGKLLISPMYHMKERIRLRRIMRRRLRVDGNAYGAICPIQEQNLILLISRFLWFAGRF